MWKFWQGFLSMYATRTGNWQLYVESINMLLPWTFAYINNYARYLRFHYIAIINLEENHPPIYEQLMKGNFSVQVSNGNLFG